jgi:small conductance mechanosensitive channel
MMNGVLRRCQGCMLLASLMVLTGFPGQSALGQVPVGPLKAVAGKGSTPKTATPGTTAENNKTEVATSTGPIAVHQQVSDREILRFLTKFLPKYPGVRHINVSVEEGVVTLTGQVDDDDTQNEITDVLKRVEGVRLVVNHTQTDDDVMTGWEFARREIGSFVGYFQREWILIVMALATMAISWMLAQKFATYSDSLLAPIVQNVLLRSVVGSIISALIIIGGLVLALAEMRLTQAVMSIVGVSGLVVLAVGFAFRDITENFIASVLLGLRRPFETGDFITVAGQTGVVKSLNTRATVLVTLDGKHIRIPNSTIFKEIMINATASPNSRTSFDVVIPHEASTATAIEAINRSLKETPGILQNPTPRTLVEDLEPGGVRLRADFWTPTRNIDWFQLMSDAKLRAKVSLQQAGVIGSAEAAQPPAPAPAPGAKSDGRPNGVAARPTNEASPPTPPAAEATQKAAAANLARDARAASEASSALVDSNETPVAHALREQETRVSDEGANLLKSTKAE